MTIILFLRILLFFNEFKPKKCGYSKLSQGDWPLSHSIPILSYVAPLWLYHPIHWDQSSINIWQYYYFNVFYCCLMNLSLRSIEIGNYPQGDWTLFHPIPVLSYVVPLCLYYPIHWDQCATNSWQYYYFNVFYWFWLNLSQKLSK